MSEAEDYRSGKFESGTRYQDFVVDWFLRKRGLVIQRFASREYQIRKGESLGGIEIKNDEKYATTRNLWIEVGEKALPRAGEYAPSGILREDNAWLYIIGDYHTIFAFAKRHLVSVHERRRYPVRENDRRTSLGFLLPSAHAHRLAVLVEIVDEPAALQAVKVVPPPLRLPPATVPAGLTPAETVCRTAPLTASSMRWGINGD